MALFCVVETKYRMACELKPWLDEEMPVLGRTVPHGEAAMLHQVLEVCCAVGSILPSEALGHFRVNVTFFAIHEVKINCKCFWWLSVERVGWWPQIVLSVWYMVATKLPALIISTLHSVSPFFPLLLNNFLHVGSLLTSPSQSVIAVTLWRIVSSWKLKAHCHCHASSFFPLLQQYLRPSVLALDDVITETYMLIKS